MELALKIAAGFGALLIVIGYLGYIVAGFKHHFVTGIISALPVLNIVTIPALWYTAAKKVIISFIGIIIFAASWYMGADEGITNLIAKLQGKPGHTTIVSNSTNAPLSLNNSTSISPATTISAAPLTASTSSDPYAAKQRFIDESNTIPLPPKALYSIRFEEIPLNNILSLKGRIIQLTMKNNQTIEGRVSAVSNSSIILQTRSATNNELPIANIKQLRLMVKKAN